MNGTRPGSDLARKLVLDPNPFRGLAPRHNTTLYSSPYYIPRELGGALFTNLGAAAAVAFVLPNGKEGDVFEFEVQATQKLNIVPASALVLIRGGVTTTAGQAIWADAQFEHVTLWCEGLISGVPTWYAANLLGTWTAAAGAQA